MISAALPSSPLYGFDTAAGRYIVHFFISSMGRKTGGSSVALSLRALERQRTCKTSQSASPHQINCRFEGSRPAVVNNSGPQSQICNGSDLELGSRKKISFVYLQQYKVNELFICGLTDGFGEI